MGYTHMRLVMLFLVPAGRLGGVGEAGGTGGDCSGAGESGGEALLRTTRSFRRQLKRCGVWWVSCSIRQGLQCALLG